MKSISNSLRVLIAGLFGIAFAGHAQPPEVFEGTIVKDFTPLFPPTGMNTGAVEYMNQPPRVDVYGRPAIRGYIQNNCPFSIWVASVCCNPGCEFKLEELRPQKAYWNPYVTLPDRCSQTIKLYRHPGDVTKRWEYQVEYSMDLNGDVWYNLSQEDGNPFADVARFQTIDAKCMWMYCPPGNSGWLCDWPRYTGKCPVTRDVRFYLC